MITATMAAFNKEDKVLQERVLECRLKEFFKRWAPEDHEERNAFDYDLLTIVRTIYAEAQAPVYAQLMKVMDCLPMQYSPIMPPPTTK